MGGAGGNYSFLNAPPPAGSFGGRGSLSGQGGLAPQATGFPGGGVSGLLPQQTGYPGAGSSMLPQQTGIGGGLLAQPTGYGGLRAQPTGLPHDPRLQAMMQTFMPSNLSQPFSSAGVPQFNQSQQQPLQQTFQTLLQNPAANTPKIPWVLTRQEKKDYDQIFRAWDTKGEGFISGSMAQEVFGQAGLGQEDLMKIWNLADGDNRGKLNLPEFHVAMGLIYRALNGNPIPDVLPEELKPASMKDIDSTVNFMKDLLKHESNTRSDNSSPVYGSSHASAAGSKDAKVYKHNDQAAGTYRSSSRHLDRKAVRYAGEESGAEISDLRRQLQNASDSLDASSKEQSRKTEEDEEIEAEIEDVSRRVRRINEDLEYVSKGRRTQDKDEEKRKLERELLFLMHEKLPELERRQQRREEEKRMEERAGLRARDKRNDTHGRYGGGGSGRDDDRDWLRGSYDRDNRDRSRDRSRDRYDYDRRGSQSRDYDRYDRDRDNRDNRDRERDHDRDYDRRRGGDDDRRRGSYDDRDRRDRDVHDLAKARPPPSPPKTASPKPEAPKAAPAPAKPAAKPWAKMTAEERAAEARRRVAERQAALGIAPAEDAGAADDTVEARLARERQEAEEKAKAADKEHEAREEARRQRLAAVTGGDDAAPAAAPAAPTPPAPPAAKTPTKKPPPVAPVRKAHAPPPAPSPRAAPPAPAPPKPPAPAVQVEDPEEAELRAAEEARKKRIAERREQLKRQEEEEEEELRRQEEELAKRRAERSAKVATPTTEPPLPPFPTSPSAPTHSTGSHNPFHRKQTADGSVPTPPATGGFNPFFRPGQAGATPAAAPAQRSVEPPKAPEAAPAVFVPPPPPPPPPAPPAPARVNSAPPPDDDWDVIQEKHQADESDSSDDEYANSRHKRGALASALFGNILPSSKPQSRSNSADPEASTSPSASKPPAAALAKLGGGSLNGGGMSALLSSIQGGARLRHTETVDRSAPVGAGGVVGGDAGPPAHINAGAPVAPPSPPPAPHADVEEDDFEARNAKRQSTDWYGSLAADSSHPAAQHMEQLSLEPTREEGAEEHAAAAEPSSDGPSLDDVDLGTILRVRTLYNYETSFSGDLPFQENVVLVANPAKDPNGPWWYATLPNGKAGWIPGSFVEKFTATPARAVYDYAAGSAEELSLTEGDALEVIDQADPDWWKVEKSGAVYIVPAAYVEIIDDRLDATDAQAQTGGSSLPGDAGIPRRATPPLQEPSPAAPQEEPHNTTNGHYDSMAQFPPLSVISSTIDEAEATPPLAPALSTQHLATPTLGAVGQANRSRTTSVSQYSVGSGGIDDGGDSSDEDSVLSYWSSDDDESDHEEVIDTQAARAAELEKAKKEEEKKRREQERQKALAAAGLTLRREAPGIPVDLKRRAAATRRRRPAPAVPQRGKKPAASPSGAEKDLPQMPLTETPDIQVQDAYARYEQFLTEATKAPAPAARPTSIVVPASRPTSVLEASSPPSTASKGSTFSGLLGRLGVGSAAAPERTTPKISGPIVSGPIGGGPISGPLTPGAPAPATEAPEPASDFGKTWGSLVDPSVLSTMTGEERKRQEAIFEFIATESSYVRDLQLIVNVYYFRLMNILDEKSLTVIFANIEDILMFNSGFLSSLDDRQKESRLYIDTIGDILADNLINLDVYRPYCVNQDTAAKLLVQLRKQDQQLDAALMDIKVNNPDVRGLELSSFLLQPSRSCLPH
ncbi:hypothetical protein VHUM_04227 [Vanrija humicola]|uniref:Actin cytoskeleton-regulatory complex protein PAN1 n=1 Tax=Vanrija humicola TaxID=5417 RepID=A0A7D8YZ43_VANHU|nr:hypothetical protein VHUM_04227 [Vanrija humicola]